MLQYFYDRNKYSTSARGKKGSAVKISDIKKELKTANSLTQQEVQSNLTYLISQGWVEEDTVDRDVSGDVAVPLALFVAEALTNIFKYAFAPGQAGVIKLALQPMEGGKLRLTIADNGAGFDENAVQRHGIGSRLIRTFGQQIGGVSTLESEIGKGTTVTVEFRDPDAAPPPPEVSARSN